MKRILIVDDDPRIHDLVSLHITEAFGYDIEHAEDGRQALDAIAHQPPDLILMDLYMPGMDGITAIRTVRERFPDLATTPIIFLSTETEKEKWVEAFEAGANDFVPKPYVKTELLARIRTHLKVDALTRELARKNELLERQRQLAKSIQAQFLPKRLTSAGLDLAFGHEAMEQIGGAFFETWEEGDRLHLVVGDVSEQGTAAALMTAVCKGLIHPLVGSGKSPLEVVSEINRQLFEILEADALPFFVSLAYCVIDRAENTMQLISAGHSPAYLMSHGALIDLGPTGPALGAHAHFPWTVESRSFSRGDVLLLSTNGLTQAEGAAENAFGEEQLLELLDPRLAPGEQLKTVFESVLAHCGGDLTADLAALCVKRI